MKRNKTFFYLLNSLIIPIIIVCSNCLAIEIAANLNTTAILNHNGQIVSTGKPCHSFYRNSHIDITETFTQIALGEDFLIALRKDGTVLYTDFAYFYHKDFDVINNWKDIVQIGAGTFYAVGLKSDGTVLSVGERLFKTDTSDWKNVKQIVTGFFGFMGITHDGQILHAGYNDQEYQNLTGWNLEYLVQIEIGRYHTVGLKKDGTVIAKKPKDKSLDFGQCDVEQWENIKQIAAGWDHTIGLKEDGTVVAAGKYRCKQPKLDVSDWTDIVQIGSGIAHVIGIKSDDTVISQGFMMYYATYTSEIDLKKSQVSYLAAPDHDRDGYGDFFLAELNPELNHYKVDVSDYQHDCDDNDPQKYPGAYEPLRMQEDMNCDGHYIPCYRNFKTAPEKNAECIYDYYAKNFIVSFDIDCTKLELELYAATEKNGQFIFFGPDNKWTPNFVPLKKMTEYSSYYKQIIVPTLKPPYKIWWFVDVKISKYWDLLDYREIEKYY